MKETLPFIFISFFIKITDKDMSFVSERINIR